jgi:hypothetical protein
LSAASALICAHFRTRAVGGLLGLLPGVHRGSVEVALGLVDALSDLLTRFGGGRLHLRLGRHDALLQRV